MPFGGSITLGMVPLVIMSYRNGSSWGLLTAFVYSLLKLMTGFDDVLYCATLLSQIGCILLDYVVAYTILGAADYFRSLFKGKVLSYAIATCIVGLLRFVCSFLSGWLLWGSYAPEGMAAPVYSFVYNISYMGPNIIIMVIIICVLVYKTPNLLRGKN